MDDREIVAAIRAQLAERVGKERYELWFGNGTRLILRDDTLVVHVRDQFYQDWLRLHFRKILESLAEQIIGSPVLLEFRISPQVEKELPAPAACLLPAVLAAATANGDSTEKKCKHPVMASDDPAPRRRLGTLESFVVGDSNCVAHKTAELAAQKPGTYSPLLVHGAHRHRQDAPSGRNH